MGQLYSYTAMTVVMNCSPLILTGAEGLSASQGLRSLQTLLEANGGGVGGRETSKIVVAFSCFTVPPTLFHFFFVS
jgi:hypothetical protein